jgi:hypothetical protein
MLLFHLSFSGFRLCLSRFFELELTLRPSLFIRLPLIGQACLAPDGLSSWESWSRLRASGELDRGLGPGLI